MSVGSTVYIKDKYLPALVFAGNVLQNKSGQSKQNVQMELKNLNRSQNQDINECESVQTQQESRELLTSQ